MTLSDVKFIKLTRARMRFIQGIDKGAWDRQGRDRFLKRWYNAGEGNEVIVALSPTMDFEGHEALDLENTCSNMYYYHKRDKDVTPLRVPDFDSLPYTAISRVVEESKSIERGDADNSDEDLITTSSSRVRRDQYLYVMETPDEILEKIRNA